ncbi:UDP-N-acetylmuramate dehydrogenase [Pseudoalteromonas citrea]|uniref:UDP-N-acetylenolpyruvoylglucosamine reductase n=2 Tax=Pseudoalteromonas citrea TaxID=43655 RepID=A0AAD4AG51_9GAMM|nr:UDP-N-acetylmuramate dehydrogenase [Pseudoalteromonas citrea]KAF7767661.1 UDP-N-acetylmuramate dehydrogenase [Pseudoalteromonas citrea]
MQALQSLHTFALPHACQDIVNIDDPLQLHSVDFSQPFCVLGAGSNTVFIEDFIGTVVRINNKGVEIVEHGTFWNVNVAAGENWHSLVTDLLVKGIAGLENLVLIPGTMGAAPVQNIGAYGVELAKFIDYVEGFNVETLAFERLNQAQCQFGYRDSIFKHKLKNKFVITKVGLRLNKQWRPTLDYGPLQKLNEAKVTALQVSDAVMEIRQSKLPNPDELPNAGSFFKNPIVLEAHYQKLCTEYANMPAYPAGQGMRKLAAGWLIEQAGLKGYSVAGVRVYEKQALVLVNEGYSSGSSLCSVIHHVQHCVARQFNIQLEHEVRLIGREGEVILQEKSHG